MKWRDCRWRLVLFSVFISKTSNIVMMVTFPFQKVSSVSICSCANLPFWQVRKRGAISHHAAAGPLIPIHYFVEGCEPRTEQLLRNSTDVTRPAIGSVALSHPVRPIDTEAKIRHRTCLRATCHSTRFVPIYNLAPSGPPRLRAYRCDLSPKWWQNLRYRRRA